ncbi:MAG: hypothetical protein EHM23_21215 [Acidobacteria bacterium]|nr:MAG: hypothetical protein EHM23_21215 [Acidobacteriota bacterium]
MMKKATTAAGLALLTIIAGTALARDPAQSHGRPRVPVTGPVRGTAVSIEGDRWLINREITYPGSKAEGLLMNVRMVNAIFEDSARPEFDAKANTREFVEKIPEYVSAGVRAFTLNLQGGFPGYEGAVNSAFNPDGSLRDSYLARLKLVLDECRRTGAIVILGCFYQRQDQILKHEEAVKTALLNVAAWVKRSGFTNVLIEVANEFNHPGFDHAVLKTPAGQVQLIRLVQERFPCLLVSTSGLGDGMLPDEVCEAADFLLPHFNSTPVSDIPARLQALKKFGKPIVCNEDDKTGTEAAAAAEACVTAGASWGFMHDVVNQHYPFTFGGPADDQVVYGKLRELTGGK